MPATAATLWMPCTMKVAVRVPNPATSEAATGMPTNAVRGDSRLVRIAASRKMMARKPRVANIAV